jgi:superfamily II DNA or RNA helicase
MKVDIPTNSVTIVVNNVFSRIKGELSSTFQFYLSSELSYKIQDSRYILEAMYGERRLEGDNRKEWDGTVNLYWPEEGNKFFTGMMDSVRKALKAANIEYDIEDRRIRPPQNLPALVFDPKDMEERPYQRIGVDHMYKATRGVCQAATGSGKTLVAAQLIGKIKTVPFLFLVLSKDLMEQAYETLSAHLNAPIGRIGDGMVDIQGINVVMVQTAVKALHRKDKKFDLSEYKFDEDDEWDDDTIEKTNKGEDIEKLITNCSGIFCDEVHHAGSKSIQEIMTAAKNAYWRIGLSATPTREDGAEKMIQALFGKILVNISASWLIQNKYLVKPFIFNISIKEELGDWKSYPQVYKAHIADNVTLNDLVVKISEHMKFLGIPMLVLVQRYNHGEALKSRMGVPFIKGNMPRKARRKAIQDLRDGIVPAAVATTLADEGLDVRRLGAAAVAGGGKSITRVYQRVGRTLRQFEGKDKALVFLFHHKCKFLDGHGRRVKNILKKEPEFVIIESTPETIIGDIDNIVRPEKGLFDD